MAAALALAAAIPAFAASRPSDRLLVASPFPIEAAPSFSGGLYHWIDSLAGTSNGKTIPAHRQEYLRRFGPLTADDKAQLAAFVTARSAQLDEARARADRTGVPARGSAMLGAFAAASSVESALAAVRGEMPAEAWTALAGALAHFRPKYEAVWDGGAIPDAFLRRARRDPSLPRLEALLAAIVRFYAVDPRTAPAPRLALVPVPDGYGTHAEAIGGVLLLEIRSADDLADEASVIVHETSHFLWSLVPADRQKRLAAFATGRGEADAREFRLLGEAIPTALGQGVADRAFRPDSWSFEEGWYHTADVDACAHRIYPVVVRALDEGQTLDETFLERVLSRPGADPILRRGQARPDEDGTRGDQPWMHVEGNGAKAGSGF